MIRERTFVSRDLPTSPIVRWWFSLTPDPVGPAFLPWTRGAMAKAVSTTYCAPLSLAISWRRFFESFLAASRRYRRRSQ